ncbi:VCBS repeat-containing protein [Candidatus Poribacteria bacterium]
MKIENSNIHLSSQHSIFEKQTVSESVRIWVGDQRPDFEGQESSAPAKGISVVDMVMLSNMAEVSQPVAKNNIDDGGKETSMDPEIRMLKLMVERMLGIEIDLSSLKISHDDGEALKKSQPVQAVRPEAEPRQGYGIEYDRHESYYESEKTNFSAEGVIKTSDGKMLSFNVNLSLSREFMTENNIGARFGDAVRLQDPLVINFGGTSAQLTNARFSFDLNADGKVERISSVGPNSGFLAIDLNNDNEINDGSELFGPKTGRGFQELAVYDSDHNNWIDESDPIYDKLLVWSKEPGGNESLVSLKQKGVGAIYLGHQSTKFELNNSQNEMQGQLSSSGIYLNEKDSAGTIQQVDLTM